MTSLWCQIRSWGRLGPQEDWAGRPQGGLTYGASRSTALCSSGHWRPMSNPSSDCSSGRGQEKVTFHLACASLLEILTKSQSGSGLPGPCYPRILRISLGSSRVWARHGGSPFLLYYFFYSGAVTMCLQLLFLKTPLGKWFVSTLVNRSHFMCPGLKQKAAGPVLTAPTCCSEQGPLLPL